MQKTKGIGTHQPWMCEHILACSSEYATLESLVDWRQADGHGVWLTLGTEPNYEVLRRHFQHIDSEKPGPPDLDRYCDTPSNRSQPVDSPSLEPGRWAFTAALTAARTSNHSLRLIRVAVGAGTGSAWFSGWLVLSTVSIRSVRP